MHTSWRSFALAAMAAAGIACGGPAAAQPVVGQVVDGVLKSGRGGDIPLPAARWRVTAVQEQTIDTRDWRVFTLRNEDPQAAVPYLFVRHALLAGSWPSPCDRPPPSAFGVDAFWPRPSELFNRCARMFVASLPTADRTGWWAGLHQGIDPADARRHGGPMLLAELTVSQHRGGFIRVEAFIRPTGEDASPAQLHQAWTENAPHPWRRAIERWTGPYIFALENGALKGQRASVEALAPPGPAPGEAERDRALAELREPPGAAPAEPAASAVAAVAVAAAQPVPQPAPKPPQSTVPVPVAAPVPMAAPTAAVAAAASARPAATPPTNPSAAPPAVSTEDLARLSAEIARLRDELKSRPNAAAPAAMAAVAPAAPVAVVPAPPAAAAPAVPAPPAAPAPAQARRLALVIGNDSYQSVARLQNARTDARAMADALGRAGYKVRLRTDLDERAMKDTLRAFKTEVQGGDEVLFYFAGHGVQIAGANYLLPTDIRGEAEDQVRDDALLLQKVLDDLQERKARFALAIVDACRDNPFRTAGRALGGRGLAPTTAATGQMVMFSAGAGQQALDRLGERDTDPNGLFTRVLLKEIDKREVSVDRVLRAVRNQVVELARSVGHEQVPALYDQSVGEFYIRR